MFLEKKRCITLLRRDCELKVVTKIYEPLDMAIIAQGAIICVISLRHERDVVVPNVTAVPIHTTHMFRSITLADMTPTSPCIELSFGLRNM